MRLVRVLLCCLLVAGCGEGDKLPITPTAQEQAPCKPTAIKGSDGLFSLGRASDCDVTVNGERRNYTVYAPAARRPGRPALVIVLHGEGGAGADRETVARVSRFDREPPPSIYSGAVIAYPEGVDGSWNESEAVSAEPGAQDDVGFIRAMIGEIERREKTDPARTFVVGWSGGGFMAHRLGCSLSRELVSIVVLHAPLRGDCEPEAPIGVLQIAGTEDPAIPYDGGTTPDGDRSPPLPRATARWRRLSGCEKPHTERDGAVVRQSAACDLGHSVDLVTVRGGGHAWYGPAETAPDDALDATAEAWAFFASR